MGMGRVGMAMGGYGTSGVWVWARVWYRPKCCTGLSAVPAWLWYPPGCTCWAWQWYPPGCVWVRGSVVSATHPSAVICLRVDSEPTNWLREAQALPLRGLGTDTLDGPEIAVEASYTLGVNK